MSDEPTAGPQVPPPPRLSPDGRFWWDGQGWQPLPSAAAPLPTAYCRVCGRSLDARAAICVSCGTAQALPVAPIVVPFVAAPQLKSPGLAVLFTILWPGAGQLYIGNSSKGTPYVVANAIGFVLAITIILIPVSFIIWVVTLCMTVGGIGRETEQYNVARFGRPS
jgi:TM2 domain-containing membrane protein YozV